MDSYAKMHKQQYDTCVLCGTMRNMIVQVTEEKRIHAVSEERQQGRMISCCVGQTIARRIYIYIYIDRKLCCGMRFSGYSIMAKCDDQHQNVFFTKGQSREYTNCQSEGVCSSCDVKDLVVRLSKLSKKKV